jgi:hypothetical protein
MEYQNLLNKIVEETSFSSLEADDLRAIAMEIGAEGYDLEQLRMGMEVELEHGTKLGENTNITNDDPIMTARIALAHLKEIPDYYTRLLKMEEDYKNEQEIGKDKSQEDSNES